jgi:hypothetical protein
MYHCRDSFQVNLNMAHKKKSPNHSLRIV